MEASNSHGVKNITLILFYFQEHTFLFTFTCDRALHIIPIPLFISGIHSLTSCFYWYFIIFHTSRPQYFSVFYNDQFILSTLHRHIAANLKAPLFHQIAFWRHC